MPSSRKEWATVWRELQSAGWLCVEHGEQQRNHYLLPLGEECRSNVRNGSYVRYITAADGSSRAVYRTRGEVLQHVGKRPLSAILASPNVLPADPSLRAPKKPAAPSRIRTASKRKPAEPEMQPVIVRATAATRSGRTVKKLRPLEAPGANGEAQLMNASDHSSESPRVTVQTEAESLADDEFLVEAVLDSRPAGSTVEYLVKWVGFGPRHNTWEPAANLNACVKLKEFQQAQNKLKKQARQGPVPKPTVALHKAGDVVDIRRTARSSMQHAKKQSASTSAHEGRVLRWTSGHEAIIKKENGVVASHETSDGVDAYWQTIVCGRHIMCAGRHSAQFTVLRGGRTLNVGVVDRKWRPQDLKNATDDLSGFGFDSDSGGYWHAGQLHQPVDSNAEALAQALRNGCVEKDDMITLTLDVKDKTGRLSVDVNGTNLGQLACDIDCSNGMVWFAELCGGESIRVEMAVSNSLV